jgi:hypothetical protein
MSSLSVAEMCFYISTKCSPPCISDYRKVFCAVIQLLLSNFRSGLLFITLYVLNLVEQESMCVAVLTGGGGRYSFNIYSIPTHWWKSILIAHLCGMQLDLPTVRQA